MLHSSFCQSRFLSLAENNLHKPKMKFLLNNVVKLKNPGGSFFFFFCGLRRSSVTSDLQPPAEGDGCRQLTDRGPEPARSVTFPCATDRQHGQQHGQPVPPQVDLLHLHSVLDLQEVWKSRTTSGQTSGLNPSLLLASELDGLKQTMSKEIKSAKN